MLKTGCRLAGSILLTVIGQIGLFAEPALGTVTVITSQETVDLSKPIPLSIANANGVKIAFQTKGGDLQTMFTLHETSLGDINLDGYVNVGDLQILVATWGRTIGQLNYDPRGDLDGNNYVYVADLQLLVANWGKRL